jgi:hypothetical protein
MVLGYVRGPKKIYYAKILDYTIHSGYRCLLRLVCCAIVLPPKFDILFFWVCFLQKSLTHLICEGILGSVGYFFVYKLYIFISHFSLPFHPHTCTYIPLHLSSVKLSCQWPDFSLFVVSSLELIPGHLSRPP